MAILLLIWGLVGAVAREPARVDGGAGRWHYQAANRLGGPYVQVDATGRVTRENGYRARPTLAVSCYQGRELLVTVLGFTPRADVERRLTVRVSVDGGPWRELQGIAAVERLLAFDMEDAKGFVRDTLDHGEVRMLVVVDRVPREQEVVFEIVGMRGVVRPVLDACGWDPSKDVGRK